MFPANTDHSTIITTIEVNKCLNITSEETGACVLLRAAGPVQGLEAMKEHRKRASLKDWEVCRGPGNLCRALCIGKEEDDLDLAEGVHIWVEEGRQVSKEEIVVCKRVNVTSSTPYRWYVRNCKSVSKRDKTAEKEFMQGLTADSAGNLGRVLGNNLGNSSDLGSRQEQQKDSFLWRGQQYSFPAS